MAIKEIINIGDYVEDILTNKIYCVTRFSNTSDSVNKVLMGHPISGGFTVLMKSDGREDDSHKNPRFVPISKKPMDRIKREITFNCVNSAIWSVNKLEFTCLDMEKFMELVKYQKSVNFKDLQVTFNYWIEEGRE